MSAAGGSAPPSGKTVVYYYYDAWGKLLSCTGSMASTLGLETPLRYRGYVYDRETGLYYLQSRYYNPTIGRFINADDQMQTSPLGMNVFAYCVDNPVNYTDSNGKYPEAVEWWTMGMSWLPFVDTVLPIFDAVYWGGVVLLGGISLASSAANSHEIAYTEVDVAISPPPPNDDDDDDYYDDDSNFGGRKKVGKSKGNAPGNNRTQNRQFRDATKGLSKAQQRRVHDKITGKGLGYHQVKEIAEDMLIVVIGIFVTDDY